MHFGQYDGNNAAVKVKDKVENNHSGTDADSVLVLVHPLTPFRYFSGGIFSR